MRVMSPPSYVALVESEVPTTVINTEDGSKKRTHSCCIVDDVALCSATHL